MITALHKHIARLNVDRQQMRDGDLKSILTNVFDTFRKHGVVNGVLTSDDSLKAMHFFCKRMVDSQVYKNILRPQIIDHELFSLMSNTILSIIQKANNCATKDSQLTDCDWNAFHAMSSLLTSSLPLNQLDDEKVNKIILKTFFNERFLTAIKECIESLSLDNHQNDQMKFRILSYVFQHVYVHSKAYKGSLRKLLLDAVVRCIASKLYADQFNKNEDVSADFLLIDCPNFVLSNPGDRHEEIANLLCQSLLKDCKNILSYRGIRKHTDSQRNEYLSSYVKLLNHCAMIESTRNMFKQYLPFIVTQIFTTLKEYLSLNDDKAINCIIDEEVVAALLTLLYNLTPNSTIHAIIKENAPIPILLLLYDNGRQQHITTESDRKKDIIRKNIQFLAQSLIVLATEDIDQLDQPEQVICLFVTYLAKAVKSDSQMVAGVHASRLLMNITAIAQNDQVKEQILEHGALRLLSDCICDPIIAVDNTQQSALNAVWTVSFHREACLIWKTDQKLVKQLQNIYDSDKSDRQKAADGILWRLTNEEKFQTEQSNIQRMLILPNGKITNTTNEDNNVWVKVKNDRGSIFVLREKLTKEQSDMVDVERDQTSDPPKKISKSYTYDLMISYSHDNYDLCMIIYNCLLKTGQYKIWIDEKEMHGSIMERMAEAIEDSHLLLVCMSRSYRLSQACQSEVEYAYKRHHRVLFLKVEPNYQPCGWLGFYLGSKYYIDITKQDFLATFKDILKQISIQRDETPDYGLIDTIVTTDVKAAVANILKANATANLTVATKPIPANSDTIPQSVGIHQPISLPSLSNSNQMKSPIITSAASSEKTTTHTGSSTAKTFSVHVPQASNIKKGLNVESPLLETSTTSIPSAVRSISSDKNFQGLNLKQQSLISSSSVASSFKKMTSTADNQSSITEGDYTPEKLAKYYPNNFDYPSVNDDHDTFNDFALKTRTPSISSLSDDEYGTGGKAASCNLLSPTSSSCQLFSSLLPQMNEDTISLSEMSLNMNEMDTPVSHKIRLTNVPYKKRPVNEWTREDVLQFFEEKNFTNMLPLFGEEINGRRLQELYKMRNPISTEILESQKIKPNYLPATTISLADYDRLESELKKILPTTTDNSVIFSNIIQAS